MSNGEEVWVLVVDDDRDAGGNLAEILSEVGYSVDVALSGEQALQLVRERVYRVALVDLKMPDQDGVSLYESIKECRPETACILTTAFGRSARVEEGLSAGVWCVFAKPIDVGRLLAAVEHATQQPTTLIVDDDKDFCDNLSQMLRQRGYRVRHVQDEHLAAERIDTGEYERLVVDLRLKNGDGRKLIERARRIRPNSQILLVTGYAEELAEEGSRRLLNGGVVEIETKPLQIERFLQRHFPAMGTEQP
ncbi:MAG: response regulator [Pirellulaceae bacterium]|nr:response regulator [Planctomycetales bacterium]